MNGGLLFSRMVLQRCQPPRAKKLRLFDVKQMFRQMKDQA
jgi:hypothetical protein